MKNKAGLRLSSYYLNTRRLSEITGVHIPVVAQKTLNENSGERAEAMRFASGIANEVLQAGSVPSLTRAFGTGSVEGPLIAMLWGAFTFRGVGEALARERRGVAKKSATFSASIPLGDTEYLLSGELSNDHLFSDTAVTILSNKRRVLMVGRFEVRDNSLEVQPYIIGDMFEDLGAGLPMSWAQRVRTYPDIIDNFAKARDVKPSTKAELRTLLNIPEDDVKHAFAAIIGEPFVPKDWGGEKSDLQTSRVYIDGRPVSSAFIFKGPSVRGEMHPASMGNVEINWSGHLTSLSTL